MHLDQVPEPSEAALGAQAGLDHPPAELAVRAVSPALAGLALVYSVLALFHPIGRFVTGSPTAPQAAFYMAAGTAVIFSVAWLALRHRTLGAGQAHRILTCSGLLMTVNASAYLWIVPDPVHTTNHILISISAGLVMISRPWLATVFAMVLAGWLVPTLAGPMDVGWFHWGAMLILSQLLAFTAHEFRLRTTSRLVQLRLLAEQRLAAAEEESSRREFAEINRRESERRLAHSQRGEGLGLMAGGVAHDFNNLLASIVGNVEIASLSEPTPAIASSLLEIQAAADQAARLCRQMLAYAGQAPIEKTAVDLCAVTLESVALLRSALPKQIRIESQLPNPTPVVTGDMTELSQILINLITNASESLEVGTGGVVKVDVSTLSLTASEIESFTAPESMTPGGFALIRVSDTGRGMVASTRERMFDPFFSTKTGSRGLGLAAALGIARSHGGGVDIWSRPGLGTRVDLYLPQSESPLAPAATARRSEPSVGPRQVVLVVDDEPGVRRMIRKLLESEGHRVFEAGGVSETLALSISELSLFDVALVDLSMPDGNGANLATTLADRHPSLRIILMSGYDREEALVGDFASSLAFLPKPFRRADLLSFVDPGSKVTQESTSQPHSAAPAGR